METHQSNYFEHVGQVLTQVEVEPRLEGLVDVREVNFLVECLMDSVNVMSQVSGLGDVKMDIVKSKIPHFLEAVPQSVRKIEAEVGSEFAQTGYSDARGRGQVRNTLLKPLPEVRPVSAGGASSKLTSDNLAILEHDLKSNIEQMAGEDRQSKPSSERSWSELSSTDTFERRYSSASSSLDTCVQMEVGLDHQGRKQSKRQLSEICEELTTIPSPALPRLVPRTPPIPCPPPPPIKLRGSRLNRPQAHGSKVGGEQPELGTVDDPTKIDIVAEVEEVIGCDGKPRFVDRLRDSWEAVRMHRQRSAGRSLAWRANVLNDHPCDGVLPDLPEDQIGANSKVFCGGFLHRKRSLLMPADCSMRASHPLVTSCSRIKRGVLLKFGGNK
jgi:hypothetical protein